MGKSKVLHYFTYWLCTDNTSRRSSEVLRSNWWTQRESCAITWRNWRCAQRGGLCHVLPSIHYQSPSSSRLLVTYISLVAAFSLSNPGKCVQFGPNSKVLEIVFRRGAKQIPTLRTSVGVACVACRVVSLNEHAQWRCFSIRGFYFLGQQPRIQHCHDMYIYRRVLQSHLLAMRTSLWSESVCFVSVWFKNWKSVQ